MKVPSRAIVLTLALGAGVGVATYSAVAQEAQTPPRSDIAGALAEQESAQYREAGVLGGMTFLVGPAADGRGVDQQCVRFVDSTANETAGMCMPEADLQTRGVVFSKRVDGSKTARHSGFAPVGAVRARIGGVEAKVQNGVFVLDAPTDATTVRFERADASVIEVPLG